MDPFRIARFHWDKNPAIVLQSAFNQERMSVIAGASESLSQPESIQIKL